MPTGDQMGICERDLSPAYVDGELDADLTLLFEEHVESCARCRADLQAHRLFVCELDAAMTDNVEIPVPAGFSKMVATRATSDMRGVRTSPEHRKALGICLVARTRRICIGRRGCTRCHIRNRRTSRRYRDRRWRFLVECRL